MDYNLRWSTEAIQNLEGILDDIKFKWSEKEVDNFKSKLSHQLDLIILNPFMFPVSSFKPGLRKAVLSKQTTIFYQVNDNIVYLTYLHINKMDISKLK
jgi:plasmid stabilization system protein ParE